MEEKVVQTILLVDDTPENIDVLAEILRDEYKIKVAPNGKSALKILSLGSIDLVLLDIMMPDMDGYEVCSQIKSNKEIKDIPVIFVTAKDEVTDESKGFEVGGVDYITKPVVPSLVKVRVQNQLTLKHQRDELTKQNAILKENAQLKDDIDRITRHDLKTPLNGIMNYPRFILKEGGLSESQNKHLNKLIESGRKMLNMVNLSLDIYKMEQKTYELKQEQINIVPILQTIFEENAMYVKAKKYNIELLIDYKKLSDQDDFVIEGEELLFYSMFANIIKNAIEASPKNSTISVQMTNSENKMVFIKNEGVIPEDMRSSFFDKYSTSGKTQGTGLGTYSAKLITETLGGNIDFSTSEEEGTSIIFSF
jgi:two-component system, sensor histidine kinase and response regulator